MLLYISVLGLVGLLGLQLCHDSRITEALQVPDIETDYIRNKETYWYYFSITLVLLNILSWYLWYYLPIYFFSPSPCNSLTRLSIILFIFYIILTTYQLLTSSYLGVRSYSRIIQYYLSYFSNKLLNCYYIIPICIIKNVFYYKFLTYLNKYNV